MQKRYWNYKDPDATAELNRWLLGIIEPGVYRGFDFEASPTMNLSLVHTLSGVKYTKTDKTVTNLIGVLLTKQGVFVKEDEAISVVIDPTGSLPRIDLLVFSHEYDLSKGGLFGTYFVYKGVPAAIPIPPTPLNPTIETIIGELKLPSQCTSLQHSGIQFKKSNVPAFADDPAYLRADKVTTLQKQIRFASGPDLEIAADLSVTIGDDGNTYNIKDLGNFGVLKYISIKPEGTTMTIHSIDDFQLMSYALSGGSTIPPGFTLLDLDRNLVKVVPGSFFLVVYKNGLAKINALNFDATLLEKNRFRNLQEFNKGKLATIETAAPAHIRSQVILSSDGNYFVLDFDPIAFDAITRPCTAILFRDGPTTYGNQFGTEISILFKDDVLLREESGSNIQLGNIVPHTANKNLLVKRGAILTFIYDGDGVDVVWRLAHLSSNIQEQQITDLLFCDQVALPSGQDSTLKNVLQLLISRVCDVVGSNVAIVSNYNFKATQISVINNIPIFGNVRNKITPILVYGLVYKLPFSIDNEVPIFFDNGNAWFNDKFIVPYLGEYKFALVGSLKISVRVLNEYNAGNHIIIGIFLKDRRGDIRILSQKSLSRTSGANTYEYVYNFDVDPLISDYFKAGSTEEVFVAFVLGGSVITNQVVVANMNRLEGGVFYNYPVTKINTPEISTTAFKVKRNGDLVYSMETGTTLYAYGLDSGEIGVINFNDKVSLGCFDNGDNFIASTYYVAPDSSEFTLVSNLILDYSVIVGNASYNPGVGLLIEIYAYETGVVIANYRETIVLAVNTNLGSAVTGSLYPSLAVVGDLHINDNIGIKMSIYLVNSNTSSSAYFGDTSVTVKTGSLFEGGKS